MTSVRAPDSAWAARSASVASPRSSSVSGAPVPGTGSVSPPSSGPGGDAHSPRPAVSYSAFAPALSPMGFSVPYSTPGFSGWSTVQTARCRSGISS
ncbi:hypothetical protein [Streptomyces microflavus]|uniref:hypothetical protein n=1 Tax=Streptomyces microflavus TaxID=1919 RepID=UPI003B20E66B